MKITIMGSGGSLGVPRAGNKWGKCNPDNPKNRRTRASLLVQSNDTNIVIDASPDFCLQSTMFNLDKIDAVLLTHEHYDHTNGLDDLRAYHSQGNPKIPLYSDKATLDIICDRFPFLFKDEGKFSAALKPVIINSYDSVNIKGVECNVFLQDHVTCHSLGYRFRNFAYSVDMANLNEESIEALKGIDYWVVDCYGCDGKSFTHANLEKLYSLIEIIKPKTTYITVLSNNHDYDELVKILPPHIKPAYDGMEIEL